MPINPEELDKFKKIKYRAFRDDKLVHVSYSMIVNDNVEKVMTIERRISIDLSWYKASGKNANLVKIYVDGEYLRDEVVA